MKVGDVVLFKQPYLTMDGIDYIEVSVEVIYVHERQIAIKFADGSLLVIPRNIASKTVRSSN